jgi:large subunit ribosomal protein L30
MPSRIRVTLVRSPIGLEKSQRLTAEALGLRRLHRSRLHHNNPQIRGMIRKIAHLVAIEEVPGEAVVDGRKSTEDTLGLNSVAGHLSTLSGSEAR